MIFRNLLITYAYAQEWFQDRCTFHDYESYKPLRQYDNSPGWCGVRYSVLNVARITAVNGMNADGCNRCLEVTGADGTNPIYVLAVDFKADPGLDIAKSSYMALFPNQNPLDPNICRWRRVNPSFCGKICFGTSEECTPGQRNLLPGYLLAPSDIAPQDTFESIVSFSKFGRVDSFKSEKLTSISTPPIVKEVSEPTASTAGNPKTDEINFGSTLQMFGSVPNSSNAKVFGIRCLFLMLFAATIN
jgi:hypothetical protein